MPEEYVAVAILWGFVFIYAIMGTMDFGAGFWAMIYVNKDKTKATNIANQYLSPTWEVTNTFIVGLVIALYGLFPGGAFTLGTVLLIPGSLILLLLAIRSAFLVFSKVADTYEKPLTYISGITGILIPALLISVLPITHANFVDFTGKEQTLDLIGLFSSPHEYSFIGFAITSSLFLSAILLADNAKRARELEAYTIYRRNALITGPIAIIMALLIMFTMKGEAHWLYDKMLNYQGVLFLSFALFIVGWLCFFLPDSSSGRSGRPRFVLVLVTIQYLLASYVYGKAHLPYLVYPEVTIQSAFTSSASFQALFATYVVAFIILVPGFILFWTLFLNEKKYLEPE